MIWPIAWLIYVSGVVYGLALGLVASDDPITDWPDILVLAIGWPLFLVFLLFTARWER